MIVVDSSVWIDNIRNQSTAEVALLRRINMEQVIVGDLIMHEVLRGVRTDADAAVHEQRFREVGVTAISNPEIAVVAATNYRALRARGITIRSATDVLIATYCIEHNHQLLHSDRDFDHFERHLGLRVRRPSGGSDASP